MSSGGGKDSGSTSTSYTPSAEEQKLMGYAVNNAETAQPLVSSTLSTLGNTINGNNTAFSNLDYSGAISNASDQINAGQQLYSNLANGNLGSAFTTNATNAIKDSVNNTLGSAVNNLASRGVINSSVASKANKDIANSASNAVAQNYNQYANTLNNVANSQLNNANALSNAYATGQSAAYVPVSNAYNISSGLQNSFITSPMSAMHNGTTTQSNTQSWGNTLSQAAMLAKIASMGA